MMCFSKKHDTGINIVNYVNCECIEEDNSTLIYGKDMFDIVKENMLQERKWNLEIIQLLKDQISKVTLFIRTLSNTC